jgi:hypothetical protein
MDKRAPVLNKYGRNYIDRNDHRHDKQVYCFDDLGTENEVNTMEFRHMFWVK